MVKLVTSYKCSNCSESLYDVDEVSKLLKVHPQTLRRWVRNGEIKAYDLRGYYFTKEQINNSIR